MNKSKLFAPFLTLLAGAIASIMMYYFQYTTAQMLPRLVVVLVAFYLIGFFIQKKVVSFVEQIKEEEEKEKQEQERLEQERLEQERLEQEAAMAEAGSEDVEGIQEGF